MYYWAREQDSIKELNHELKDISGSASFDWRNFCRDLCATYFVNNPQQIGDLSVMIFIIKYMIITLGPGHIVQINESAFQRSKYDHGRFIKTQ